MTPDSHDSQNVQSLSLNERTPLPQGDLSLDDTRTISSAPQGQTPPGGSTPASGPDPGQFLVPGPRFGRYVLVRELGHGGMGVVHLAQDTLLGREVGLKMFPLAMAAKAGALERFQREAQAVAQLKHPHIVHLLDYGEIDGIHYFTMDLARGGSLAQDLPRFQADQRRAVALLEKVARAVQHVHDNHLLHRDIKPGNILLDREGQPLLSDFGLAKFLVEDMELTHSGDVLGTPAYMAPEQAAGFNDRLSPATDVWALGVVLYELLLAARPFTGQSREEITRCIRENDPPRPRSVLPRFDRNLETILLKCLEKDPARRYPSAGALADDLGAWLRGEPIKARRPNLVERLWRWRRRHPVLTTLIILAALAPFVSLMILDRLDPERPLRELEARLRSGQTVTLLEDGRPPPWTAFRLPGAFITSPKDKVHALQSASAALLELVPQPPGDAFEVSAEVEYAPNQDGEAGIFVCYKNYPTDDGEFHGFLGLVFSDYEKRAALPNTHPWRKVRLAPILCGQPRLGQLFFQEYQSASKLDNPPEPLPVKRKWRYLQIKVDAERIEAFFDHKSAGSITQDRLASMALTLAQGNRIAAPYPGLKELPLQYPRRGGFGLYVNHGQASFRNVMIKPSKGTEP